MYNILFIVLASNIHSLNRYLEFEHSLHCRPNDIGPAGLSALPLDYIWYKGNKTSNRTDPFLPNCTRGMAQCRLNGSEAYHKILGYFTTKDIHPLAVHELGWENLNKLYPQVKIITKFARFKNRRNFLIHKCFTWMYLEHKHIKRLNYINFQNDTLVSDMLLVC